MQTTNRREEQMMKDKRSKDELIEMEDELIEREVSQKREKIKNRWKKNPLLCIVKDKKRRKNKNKQRQKIAVVQSDASLLFSSVHHCLSVEYITVL